MTLWTFGDSFSCSFKSNYSWVKKYVKYKNYIPKNFSEILSEELNCDLINCAKSGDSNYGIFHEFISEVEKINEEDFVIVEFTSVYRYRLIDKKGNFSSMAAHWDYLYDDFNESKITLQEIGFNRLSEKYLEEIDDWIKTIKLLLPKNKIIFWTPFIETAKNPDFIRYTPFTTISVETDGDVRDSHYGEIGHKELADFMLKKIIKNEKKLY